MADPFELDADRNPCTYKGVCKKCPAVRPEDRPERCVDIKCEDYTPCRTCKRNMALDVQGYCTYCNASSKKTAIRNAEGKIVVVPDDPPTHPLLQGSTATRSVDAFSGKETSKAIGISFPGTAPSGFTDDEAKYYDLQWQSYSGYYRDPSVYNICHNIILMEIELNHVGNLLMSHRGSEDSRRIEDKQSRLIANLKGLRNQLPEKDAINQSEDEMVIAMIHKKYLEETKNRRVGGVARIMSQDAIALAPNLEFPVDPLDIASRLGYRIADAAEVMNRFVSKEDMPKDFKDLMEFLGFYLTQQYALQDGDVIPTEDFEPVMDDDDFAEDEVKDIADAIAESVSPTPPLQAYGLEPEVGFSVAGE